MLLCLSINDRDPRIARVKLAFHLRGLVQANRLLMETQSIPPLYQSGVRYQVDPESATVQRLLDCTEVLEARAADCKSLAAYRLAEYQHAARSEAEAEAYQLHIWCRDYDRDPLGVGLLPQGGICRVWHVEILKPNGTREDPSAQLRRT